MGMHTLPPARIPGILILLCIIIPAAVQAIDPLWTLQASPGVELSGVALSHDGSIIVAGGDQLIALSPDGTKLWSGWSGTMLDVNQDGRYIVTSQGSTVRLFSRQGILLWDASLGDVVTGVSLLPGAEMIAAGGGNYVQSWYNSGSGLGKNVTETVHDIQISPVKDQIIVTTAKALRSYNVSYAPNWYDDTISPGAIEISDDGTGIVISNGNHLRMYHGSGTLLWDRSFPGGTILSLAYSRDGSTIVAGRDDATVLVIDREGNLLFTGKGGLWVTSVGISDNGSIIATGSIDKQVHLFNRQGTMLGTFRTKNPIKSRSVAVSGDGSLIVAVDRTDVYGFSRSQVTAPFVVSTPIGSGNVTTAAVHDNATPVATIPGAGIPTLSANASVSATGTTPASGHPWILTLAALVLIIVARKNETTSCSTPRDAAG